MTRAFLTVFGIADADGLIDGVPVSMTKTAVAAVRKGYAVVPLRPGTKVPDICTLTARDLKAAGPKHDCGVGHYITDDVVAKRVFDRVGKLYEAPLNLGIIAGPSRLINVDADTRESVNAFLNDWATAEDDPGYLAHSPTVKTPGAYRDGEWKHSDGGHWYFTVPDDFDWTSYATTVVKAPGNYDVRWGRQMSVVPPSSRSEGPYVPLSDVQEAPQFLLDMIEASAVRSRAQAERREELYANDTIALWSTTVTWADLLVPDGWSDTSKIDNCGCPIFEKPGGGSTSYKSATGHEGDCAKWENIEGHGPLHVWTTDPPAPLDWYVTNVGQTITKLRYVALTQHDDDVAMAKIDLGIDVEPDFDSWLGVTAVTAVTDTPSQPSHDAGDGCDDSPTPSDESRHQSLTEPAGEEVTAVTDDPSTPSPSVTEALPLDPIPFITAAMERFGHPEGRAPLIKIAFAKSLDEHVARTAKDEFVRAITGDSVDSVLDMIDAFATEDEVDADDAVPEILYRTDGVCLFCRGRTNWILGRRGSGKTWLAILALVQVLLDGGRAIYFDFEDRWPLFKDRLITLGLDPEPYRRSGHLVWINKFPTNAADLPAFTDRVGQFDIAIFDVINRMVTRLDGSVNNSNDEVIWLTDNLFDPIARLGTAVVILDHPKAEGQRKDAEIDLLNPGGGAMKGNNASGVMIGMKAVRAFTRDNPAGHVRLYCLKDRTGHFVELDPVGEFRGSMDINDLTGSLGLKLVVDIPGEDPFASGGIEADIAQIQKRVFELLGKLGPLSGSDIRKNVTARLRPLVEVTLEGLVEVGDLTVDDAGLYALKELE